MNAVIIISVLLLINFINSWVKVAFFMWAAKIKGSSFKYTIVYMMSKKELKELFS